MLTDSEIFQEDRVETTKRDILYAIDNGIIELLEESLNTGKVDVNRSDIIGTEPLIYYALRVGNPEVIQILLLNYGADVNGGPDSSYTPLREAVDKGQEGMVEMLLNYGADVNRVSTDKSSALMQAASKGHIGIVGKLLGKEETNVNAVDKHGNSALTYAINYAIAHATNEDRMKIAKMLLARGAEVNGTSSLSTALGKAALAGDIEVFDLLIFYKADVNEVGSSGTSILDYIRYKFSKFSREDYTAGHLQIADRLINLLDRNVDATPPTPQVAEKESKIITHPVVLTHALATPKIAEEKPKTLRAYVTSENIEVGGTEIAEIFLTPQLAEEKTPCTAIMPESIEKVDSREKGRDDTSL
jgi:ankyrin repeat protein